MNSRYMRPPPENARMPRMQPLNWPTMTPAPAPQIAPQEGSNALMSGLTQLGTAAVNYKSEPEAPAVAMPTPSVEIEPPIPIAPVPEYGARPENAMLTRKSGILGKLFGA